MNPYETSSCPNHTGIGTNFPCGDSFIVYPGDGEKKNFRVIRIYGIVKLKAKLFLYKGEKRMSKIILLVRAEKKVEVLLLSDLRCILKESER